MWWRSTLLATLSAFLDTSTNNETLHLKWFLTITTIIYGVQIFRIFAIICVVGVKTYIVFFTETTELVFFIIKLFTSNSLLQLDLVCSCHKAAVKPVCACWFELPHDKTNKMTVCPAKTQISLGTCPVWSESSMSAWRNIGSSATQWAHCEDWSDWADAQADLSLCWAHRSFCWFCLICKRFL